VIDGIAVIDKPAGITSHDVVYRARKALGQKRIGHAGTLDPPATGVLILGVGRATRLMRFAEAYEKGYSGTIIFGATTTTLDATGETLTRSDAGSLTQEAIDAASAALTGDILQVPPMVSAVKVDGERLYAKARRGEEVERRARPVRVDRFTVDLVEPGFATFEIVCSRGTYVRVLAADLGDAVGVGAHLGSLRRTRVGPFTVEASVPLDALEPDALRPMEDLLAGYPRRVVTSDDARAFISGQRLPAAGIDGPYGVFSPDGLIAVAEDRGTDSVSLCVVAQR
jgi:tRNA pseudouridine55 synthase